MRQPVLAQEGDPALLVDLQPPQTAELGEDPDGGFACAPSACRKRIRWRASPGGSRGRTDFSPRKRCFWTCPAIRPSSAGPRPEKRGTSLSVPIASIASRSFPIDQPAPPCPRGGL